MHTQTKWLPIKKRSFIRYKSVFIAFVFLGCSDSKVKKLYENVDIEMVNEKFNVVIDRDTDYEWRYWEVDSIAMIIGRGNVLLYGKADQKKEKRWFYITGGELEMKKGFGNWHDGEFRKYRLIEIDKNRSLYRTLLPTKELWNRY